jgi:hypothetical protein
MQELAAVKFHGILPSQPGKKHRVAGTKRNGTKGWIVRVG